MRGRHGVTSATRFSSWAKGRGTCGPMPSRKGTIGYCTLLRLDTLYKLYPYPFSALSYTCSCTAFRNVKDLRCFLVVAVAAAAHGFGVVHKPSHEQEEALQQHRQGKRTLRMSGHRPTAHVRSQAHRACGVTGPPTCQVTGPPHM